MPKFSPGTHVAGYQVVRLVAYGDFTEVYEVVDQNGARWALRVLDRERPLDSPPQLRLALAGDVAATVVHPNVVRYHDIDIHQGRVVLVLDFVDGVDLRRVLDEAGGKLEPRPHPAGAGHARGAP
jgi:serine/threonine-protein kinase